MLHYTISVEHETVTVTIVLLSERNVIDSSFYHVEAQLLPNILQRVLREYIWHYIFVTNDHPYDKSFSDQVRSWMDL